MDGGGPGPRRTVTRATAHRKAQPPRAPHLSQQPHRTPGEGRREALREGGLPQPAVPGSDRQREREGGLAAVREAGRRVVLGAELVSYGELYSLIIY